MSDRLTCFSSALQGATAALVLMLSVSAAGTCRAADDGTGPVPACTPSSQRFVVTDFVVVCDKRLPAGTFLGSYLSPETDSVGDCYRRCAANGACQGFSLNSAAPPASRICTLVGSYEGLADEPASVVGVRAAALVSTTAATAAKATHHAYSQKKGAKRPNQAVPAVADDVELTTDMKALQPVYFATDRVPAAAGAAFEAAFTAGRGDHVSYGQTIVSIPKSHVVGNVERPKFRLLRWGVEAATDGDHFRIKALTSLDHDTFVDQLKNASDSILLFVHGYNVTFGDAVFKAAQIAFDANFPGTVVVFSWPSAGQLLKYDEDRDSAETAGPDLAMILRMLSEDIGKKDIYLVAHSMGNQVMVNALQQNALSKSPLTINELVLAAPDVDKDVFRSKADQIRSVAKNITLYASAADKALLASGKKSSGERIGFVGPDGPVLFDGVQVIDVTAAGDDMFGLDHGTFASSGAVLADLGRLIRSLTHIDPVQRTPILQLMPDKMHQKYWMYPH